MFTGFLPLFWSFMFWLKRSHKLVHGLAHWIVVKFGDLAFDRQFHEIHISRTKSFPCTNGIHQRAKGTNRSKKSNHLCAPSNTEHWWQAANYRHRSLSLRQDFQQQPVADLLDPFGLAHDVKVFNDIGNAYISQNRAMLLVSRLY